MRMSAIILSLLFNICTKWIFFSFSFNNCDCFVIYEKKIITFEIALHKCFFYSLCVIWHILVAWNDFPTCILKLLVYLNSCFFFWKHTIYLCQFYPQSVPESAIASLLALFLIIY